MAVDLPQITSKTGGPLVKQFSVFLPNKVGALLDVVKLLNLHNTHVVALSISESTDSAIARIVVSDPESVEEIFRRHEVAFGVCEMVVVELRGRHTIGKAPGRAFDGGGEFAFQLPALDTTEWFRRAGIVCGRHRMRIGRASGRRIQDSQSDRYFSLAGVNPFLTRSPDDRSIVGIDTLERRR